MFSKNLIFLLIIVYDCIRTMQAATKPPTAANYMGSNAIAAGNPAQPSFPLTPTQLISLGPIHPDVYQDTLLPAPLLSYKRGYGSEVHRVVTSDGYILEVHRILSSPRLRSSRRARHKPVVFLQHGFVDSSATWVMSGVEHGFGYALADAGYDVWMGNARGNVYSRKHIKYDPDGSPEDRQRFWTFSWHEIGMIDIPEMLDYVLNKTNQENLFYVGHSQGSTAFFVMLSERPEYNAKIKMMHAMAPVAYIDNAISPVLRVADIVPMALHKTVEMLGFYEFLPNLDLFKLIGQQLCRDTSPFIAICENVLFLIVGFNERNLNATLFPVFLSHLPAGSSTYQLVHYIQGAKSGRFCQFDWGSTEENIIKHGRPIPPDYNLSNVKSRVILHYSDNDWLSSPIDVERLFAKLPNAQINHIPDKRFEHMDFVWGIGAKEILYKPIIQSFKLHDILARTLF